MGKDKTPSTSPEALITQESVREPGDNSLPCNLLPGGSATKDAGIYAGEGLLLVPAKLALMDMAELLRQNRIAASLRFPGQGCTLGNAQ